MPALCCTNRPVGPMVPGKHWYAYLELRPWSQEVWCYVGFVALKSRSQENPCAPRVATLCGCSIHHAVLGICVASYTSRQQQQPPWPCCCRCHVCSKCVHLESRLCFQQCTHSAIKSCLLWVQMYQGGGSDCVCWRDEHPAGG